MILVALAVLALLMFLLLTNRAALSALSTMALSRLAEEDDPALSRGVKAYLEKREAYNATLQLAILLSAFAGGLLVSDLSDDISGAAALVGSFAALLVLAVAAQVAASLNPHRALLHTLPLLRILLLPFGVITVPLGAFLAKRLAAARERFGQVEEDKDEEIAALISVGTREGIFEGEDSALIRGVLEFGDTITREVMTPRTDMVSAPARSTVTEAAQLLAKARHTRLPVYEGQIDNVVGVAYLKDFLAALLSGEGDKTVSDFARPVPFVPETKPISDLLREFQEKKLQMAMVVDEYGGVDGLVTTEDLLEEIVGEIQDYDEEEEDFIETGSGVLEVSGRAPVEDLADRLGVDIPDGDYDSVAGWITTTLGAIPQTGRTLTIDGLEVEVLAADKQRLHRLQITLPPGESAPARDVPEQPGDDGPS